MKYFYKIGHYDYEASSYVELTHNKKFTKKELDKIICEATAKAIKIDKKEGSDTETFEEVFDTIIKVLIKEYRFKCLKYDLVWDTIGSTGLFDKWGQPDKNGEKILKYLKEKEKEV